MTDDPFAIWSGMNPRERVMAVVEIRTKPATVSDIADEADVTQDTAKRELAVLEDQNRVIATTINGTAMYRIDPQELFDVECSVE